MGLVVKGTSHPERGNDRRMEITHCTPGEERAYDRGCSSVKGVEKGWAVAVGGFEPGFAPCP